jgi:catechol 2,3-dioxygenase-like lactoylglutathione lyase family enzyme
MHRLLLSAALLLLPVTIPAMAQTAAATSAPAPAEAEPYTGSHLKRPTILVSNLDASLKLYRDILGFRLDMVMPLKETSYAYTMFAIDQSAKMRMAFLSSDTQQRTLALIEVSGMAISVPRAPRPASFVVTASDLPGMIRKAGDMGLTVFKLLNLTTVDGRTGKEQGLLDPDGHLVILYQLDGE